MEKIIFLAKLKIILFFSIKYSIDYLRKYFIDWKIKIVISSMKLLVQRKTFYFDGLLNEIYILLDRK